MKPVYDYLKGMTKKQVLEEMGDECNFFQSDVWTYILYKTWLTKNVLVIEFENEKATNIKIKLIVPAALSRV
jgi:hypothetical protein